MHAAAENGDKPSGGVDGVARLADRRARAADWRRVATAICSTCRPARPRCCPGPTGERNTYTLGARGTVLCVASTASGARAQFAAVLATGNKALFAGAAGEQLVARCRRRSSRMRACARTATRRTFDAVLFEGDSDELLSLVKEVAKRPGPIVSVQGVAAASRWRAATRTTRSNVC